ncbi:MAG: DNA-binding protein [Deltaproteobacteria bacterium HGW-Deltaproteobacteria-12]|jgi:hypothetical protein|nr:MAG: DNA-binding protein [Deltaproteobacteria bacterium HGW-Deltaproteobacteria-12]
MENTENKESLTTREYAAMVRVESQTIRRAYCINGHYLDVIPHKLKNKRLLWPKADCLRVIGAV